MVAREGLERATDMPLQAEGMPTAFVGFDSEGPRQPVHVKVPALIAPSTASEIEPLVWRPTAADPLLDVRWCLDAFISLEDAEVNTVRDFARRYGPLIGSHSERYRSTRPTALQATMMEAIPLWRALAHSLHSLLAIASDVLADRRPDGYEWVDGQSVLKVVQGLHENWPEWHRESDRLRAGLHDVGVPTTHGAQIVQVRQTMNALLEAAGVRVDSGFGESCVSAPSFALPGHADIYFTATGAWSQSVVDGLLPLLALQAIGVMRDNRIHTCDGCGRRIPLPQGAPRPRRGIPFYGDHEECRRAARLKSKRESKRKRTQRQREAEGARSIVNDDGVDHLG